MSQLCWPYVTPGIKDELFDRLPGIPMSKREVRVLILSQMQLRPDSVVWDIGAGTGTIPVEVGHLCRQGKIVAIERDQEVANLIRRNCQKFEITNVQVVEGNAPECLQTLVPNPDCVVIEGGRPIKDVLTAAWQRLNSQGRIVATTTNLEGLYAISEGFAELQVRNVEVVQSAVNRLERRGPNQTFAALDPMFVLSGEKVA
ncbi:MAG: precorrin-6Y C5,15-methyltransferase subunit CbiT [Cyanobacteria bacterium P01_H01_bin.121]